MRLPSVAAGPVPRVANSRFVAAWSVEPRARSAHAAVRPIHRPCGLSRSRSRPGEPLFRRLGFQLSPRGFHAGRGSSNHTAPFPGGTYLELIQLPDGNRDNRFTSRPEGPVAVVLRPSDTVTVQAELTGLGYDAPPTRDLSRPVALPEGVRDARFLVATFPEIAPEALALAVCQHLTPELVWRPEWQDHPNGARRIAEIIVVHPEPRVLHGPFAALFGEAAARIDEAGLAIALPEGAPRDGIVILTPAAFAARFPDVALPEITPRGWFAGVVVAVDSLDRTAAVLREGGVTHRRGAAGTLVVAPEDGGGALLEFRET